MKPGIAFIDAGINHRCWRLTLTLHGRVEQKIPKAWDIQLYDGVHKITCRDFMERIRANAKAELSNRLGPRMPEGFRKSI